MPRAFLRAKLLIHPRFSFLLSPTAVPHTPLPLLERRSRGIAIECIESSAARVTTPARGIDLCHVSRRERARGSIGPADIDPWIGALIRRARIQREL